MNKLYAFLMVFGFCVLKPTVAQNVNYTIIADKPGLGDICNVYFSPNIMLDFPFYTRYLDEFIPIDGMTLGYGFRSSVILKQKLQVDVNYWKGLWPARSRLFEFGGDLIVRQSTKMKELPIVLSQTEKQHMGRSVIESKYINVPGTQLNFMGLRGGLHYHRSVFVDSRLDGITDSYGIYGGISLGIIRNLQIRLQDKRVREHSVFYKYYFDVILAYNNHTYFNGVVAGGSPIGFRIGRDMNNPMSGFFAMATNVEIGYRPGLNGFYMGMAITPVNVRRKMEALN